MPTWAAAPEPALVRRMAWGTRSDRALETLLAREWIVTNGLGGYASGTIAGVPTRRYHGLLIAALPAPLGRVIMLNQMTEHLVLANGGRVQIGGEERVGGPLSIPGADQLEEFRLEMGLPVWRYRIGEVVLEKRLLLVYGQNTVHVSYRLVSGQERARLEVRPALHFRPHEQELSDQAGDPYALSIRGDRYEVSLGDGLPLLRLLLHGERAELTVDRHAVREVFYREEARRGYEAMGALWTPGYFRADMEPQQDVVLVASTESWETISALTPQHAYRAESERRHRLLCIAHPSAQTGLAAELVLAADKFVVKPAGRIEDAARAHAWGEEVRTIIAGYPWFTDWGRDTMIGLEGLTLTTGRTLEAGYILRNFAHYVRDGLIPNMFPERNTGGLYNTADATLWFFHALDRYLRATDDRETLRLLLPALRAIVDWHVRGTRFGIKVDPKDGLLSQGEEGLQLTWMDAKVDDWVVTPRRGKAVEINALWYNALCLLLEWDHREDSGQARHVLATLIAQVRRSFNERFWHEAGGYLYDVVDGEHGDDPACRPNQVFALSLPNPVLDQEHWGPVMDVVTARLLTPMGLRSLAPDQPNYKPNYEGDVRSRDAAYHQGTVWAWLIGPYVDAWLKLHPEDPTAARDFLDAFEPHLAEAGLGSISEIFDAEPPFTPRGCIAQAWSVAEVLRALVLTASRESVDGIARPRVGAIAGASSGPG